MPKTRSRSIKKEEEGSKTELKNTQLLNGINTIVTRTRGSIAKRRAPEKHDNIKKENHSLILPIKEEEEIKSEYKNSQFVNNINAKTKTKRSISERESSKNSNSVLSVSQVKPEELDTKSLLQAPQLRRYIHITQDKIQQLIKYIVYDKLSVLAASRKVNINRETAYKYYNMYKNDPEQKIPEPRNQYMKNKQPPSYKQIKALICHVENDKLSVAAASRKVNISGTTGRRYYTVYTEDPERKIPQPRRQPSDYHRSCTQDQIKTLIDCIEKDKMSVTAASRKVNMPINTATRYHLRYLNDPNHGIPTPRKRGTHSGKHCTQDQIKELIHYIVNDKMTIQAASVKLNMSQPTASKHYNRYLNNLKTQHSANITTNLTK